MDLLGELVQMLQDAAPDGQFLWSNQQLVHVFIPQQREPWATIHTKRPQALYLTLTGPKGKFALGQLVDLAADRELDTSGPKDAIKLQFIAHEHLGSGGLAKFLASHLAVIRSGK
jgi:excinuclease ABC subunit A